MNKRIKRLFLAISLMTIIPIGVNASSVTAGRGYSQVTKGSYVRFYVYLNDVAAWNITAIGGGSTNNNCSIRDVGDSGTGRNTNKTLSVDCYASDLGQIGFTVTGDYTTQDGSTHNVSTGTTVTVVKPRDPDSNNLLSSLEIEGYDLTPSFNAETLEYTTEVPSSVDKVNIKASKASGYAQDPTGVGEHEVTEGSNNIEITVTSETGVSRTYKINVIVKDDNPITVKLNDKSYTIMKNLKDLAAPDGFESSTIKINEFEIPVYLNKTINITLVGIKDEKGNKVFASYDSDNKTYQLFNYTKSERSRLYILPLKEEKENFHKDSITINSENYECLKHNKDNNLIVVYAKDLITGKENYYTYDVDTKTFILYHDSLEKSYLEEINKYKEVMYILMGIIALFALVLIIMVIKRPKKEKKIKEKKETIEKIIEEPETKEIEPKPSKEKKTKSKKKNDIVIEEKQENIEDDTMFDILNDGKKKKKSK